jgi:superoxide dismutase, Cu-Zn family
VLSDKEFPAATPTDIARSEKLSVGATQMVVAFTTEDRSMRAAMLTAAVALFCSTVAFGQAKAPMAKAELHNSQGQLVGVATLTEGINGVTIVAHVQNLPPGYHGFHIHQTGKCEAPDFKSAGEHFNPQKAEHGLADPKGPHAGDLPNLLVAPDGVGTIVTQAPMVSLKEGKNSLFHSSGTALVVHSEPDDHVTNPSGESGDRLACGVIAKAAPAM